MSVNHRFLSLLLLPGILVGLGACSFFDPGFREHPISKNISSPLLKHAEWSMKAQPNGYAVMEYPWANYRVYLSKNDLKQMQKVLDGFASFAQIGKASGIDVKKTVFHVDRWQNMNMVYCSRGGDVWVEIWLYLPHNPSNNHSLRISPAQIGEARKLFADTLAEMDALQQVERNLDRLH